jgi:hypothetical protein
MKHVSTGWQLWYNEKSERRRNRETRYCRNSKGLIHVHKSGIFTHSLKEKIELPTAVLSFMGTELNKILERNIDHYDNSYVLTVAFHDAMRSHSRNIWLK